MLAAPTERPRTHVEEATDCSEHVEVVVVHCDICESCQDARQVPKEGCLGRDELYVDQLCPGHILQHVGQNVDSSWCMHAGARLHMYLGGQGDAAYR